MTSNLQKKTGVHLRYVIYTSVYLHISYVSVYISHLGTLLRYFGEAVTQSRHRLWPNPVAIPIPRHNPPSVGLGGTWHFQEIPMNHSTNRQALMLGDLYGTPQWDWNSVCKQKSLKFHELYAISFNMRE